MGEPVSVIAAASATHGRIRYETNRWLTGMGHERYRKGDEIWGHRPPDEIARRLLDTGRVDQVHVYGQTVTVELTPGAEADGLQELIEDTFTYYRPGVEVPTEDSFQS